jgi:hypothetical protein
MRAGTAVKAASPGEGASLTKAREGKPQASIRNSPEIRLVLVVMPNQGKAQANSGTCSFNIWRTVESGKWELDCCSR